MDDNTNRFISSMTKWALMNNAHFCFNRFVERVKKGIKNDGKDEFLKFIDEYVINDSRNQFNICIPKDTVLYRARLINEKDFYEKEGLDIDQSCNCKFTIGFDEGNSREAPLGISKEGRNNTKGISYLYLADGVETACVEVKPLIGQMISIAEFRVANDVYIYDLSSEKSFEIGDSIKENVSLGELFTLIMQKYFEPVCNPDEYIATQVITDHIRKTGIDGISYKSAYNKEGINYTFFNSNRKNFEFLGSRIMVAQGEKAMFYDLNHKKTYETESVFSNKLTEEDAEEIINNIGLKLGKS